MLKPDICKEPDRNESRAKEQGSAFLLAPNINLSLESTQANSPAVSLDS